MKCLELTDFEVDVLRDIRGDYRMPADQREARERVCLSLWERGYVRFGEMQLTDKASAVLQAVGGPKCSASCKGAECAVCALGECPPLLDARPDPPHMPPEFEEPCERIYRFLAGRSAHKDMNLRRIVRAAFYAGCVANARATRSVAGSIGSDDVAEIQGGFQGGFQGELL
ncbi:hypothetical protein DES40_1735 [Litorimonas taeanensis]|uniref:Uncharacterized protein n=1 Tax=Litorimonas taeanensis TaxID=568099 RepID=A0A420WD59_9PROT|nr:hypothetical protein [Litorimonas taeanensis]RKQ68959.1 hypothetical protein DES40_1735 [Litorimonas taeanensis]